MYPSYRPLDKSHECVIKTKLLSLRFFKKVKEILLSPPSIRPLCYPLLNRWTKFNQIWCLSKLLTRMGHATAIFACPAPSGQGEGSKGQISFNFNYKVIFKDFLYHILCLFSQMKDTKHVRQDFNSVAWVMPQGSDLGALGVPRG